MEQVSDGRRRAGPRPFNSALETGVRAVFILEASHPRPLDLLQLTWFDHLVVHTADLNGPPSLHPDIPERTGELLVRRRTVQQGLNLMRRLHLVDTTVDTYGIRYQASDDAPAFVEVLRTPYAQRLQERARWLMGHLAQMDDSTIERYVADKVGRWAVEFQGSSGSEGPSA
ncbi:ABC-three component system middle component 2 [Corallococcus sp. AS-1-6]|uniref:ABC-three component system middle component 2 n=1 Tax=Corallococcus sp. AS-1-6 TaxID=2874599 RepID=UPI001CC11228|nr:hypothetical protein [Corallococcus sp. AS-1-6]